MNNCKHYGILFLITFIVFAFIACDNDNEKHTHTWGEWQQTKAPTLKEDGEETRTCSSCGEKEKKSIDKLGIEQQFTIINVSFTFTYRKDDTSSWEKLNPVIQNYIEYITNPAMGDSVHATNIVSLSAREGANYKIIVDYSSIGKSTGFVAIDGQTLNVGSDYLVNATINRNTLRDAFSAILSKPFPIE